MNIGDVLLQQRQYEPAQRELQAALKVARKKKLTKDELTAGLYLIEAQIALGLVDEAQTELDAIQPLLANAASACARGNAIRLRAKLHWMARNSAEAMENFEHALGILADPECQYELALTHLDLAPIFYQLGRQEKAQQAFTQAEQLFESLNNQLGLASVGTVRSELYSSET